MFSLTLSRKLSPIESCSLKQFSSLKIQKSNVQQSLEKQNRSNKKFQTRTTIIASTFSAGASKLFQRENSTLSVLDHTD